MERFLFLFLIYCTTCFSMYAQKYTPEIICSTDTLLIEPMRNRYYVSQKDSAKVSDNLESYKAVKCIVPAKLALRLDVGITGYYYGNKTNEWLGSFYAPNFGIAFSYDKFSVGARFKPWTLNPKKELGFNGETLPLTANLNPIKIDFFAGYSFDFDHLISLEPQIGYTKSSFHVINEDVLNKRFSIPATDGLLLGCSINKYFKIQPNNFLSVFLNVGYATNDFTKTHSSLDKGYFEWSLGVSIKSFYRSTKLRRVE